MVVISEPKSPATLSVDRSYPTTVANLQSSMNNESSVVSPPDALSRSLHSSRSNSSVGGSVRSLTRPAADLAANELHHSLHGNGKVDKVLRKSPKEFYVAENGTLRVRVMPPESYKNNSLLNSNSSHGKHRGDVVSNQSKKGGKSANRLNIGRGLSKASDELLNSTHEPLVFQQNGPRRAHEPRSLISSQSCSKRSIKSSESVKRSFLSENNVQGGDAEAKVHSSGSMTEKPLNTENLSLLSQQHDELEQPVVMQRHCGKASTAEDESFYCSDHGSVGDTVGDVDDREERTTSVTTGDAHGCKTSQYPNTLIKQGSGFSKPGLKPETEHIDWKIQNGFELYDLKVRQPLGLLLTNDYFQVFIVVLIVINAIGMGIATLDYVELNPSLNNAFDISDQIFLIIFTIELFLQFLYHGYGILTDGWLLFDTTIVILSWSLESLQIVRAFRIFRAFRLITRLQVLKNLVTALFAVAPSMTAIIALLVLILYVFAVLCTSLFMNLYAEGKTDLDYFGTLDASLFTLFDMMTLEWADIARQVMAEYYWSSILFTIFLVFTSFILYSLIIAVVCDAVKVTEEDANEDDEVTKRQESMQRLNDMQHRVDQLSRQQSDILETLQLALLILQKQEPSQSSSQGSRRRTNKSRSLQSNSFRQRINDDGNDTQIAPKENPSIDATAMSTRNDHQLRQNIGVVDNSSIAAVDRSQSRELSTEEGYPVSHIASALSSDVTYDDVDEDDESNSALSPSFADETSASRSCSEESCISDDSKECSFEKVSCGNNTNICEDIVYSRDSVEDGLAKREQQLNRNLAVPLIFKSDQQTPERDVPSIDNDRITSNSAVGNIVKGNAQTKSFNAVEKRTHFLKPPHIAHAKKKLLSQQTMQNTPWHLETPPHRLTSKHLSDLEDDSGALFVDDSDEFAAPEPFNSRDKSNLQKF